MQIGQKITITPERFKYLAKYRGLVLIHESSFGSTFMLYYCSRMNQYVSSIKSLYYEGIPGTPMNASWSRMSNGTIFTIHKINYPTTLKHLH